MNSIYGSFRNNIFTDVKANDWTLQNDKKWDDVDNFLADWKDTIFYTKYHSATEDLISDSNMNLIYYLLYSNYGNSVVASSDENRFKYKLFSLIFQFGPTWIKRLDIQDKLRKLTDAELAKGTMAVYNRAANPQTTPATDSLTPLGYINEQNVTGYNKSKMDQYAQLWELLDTDVTNEFVNQFKSLFLVVVAPERPLLYESEVEE